MATRKKLLWILLCLLTLALAIRLFYYDNSFSNPLHFSSYSEGGYYEIQPKTLLYTLNQGELNIFTPASDDVWFRDEPYYGGIQWSQTDYLKIADALSREVWHEPLNLQEWEVLALWLDHSCVDNNPQGFSDFHIVYFQRLGAEFWHRQYRVRYVEIITWQGAVRWGESLFFDAILPGWRNTGFDNFKVTADDALSIVDKNDDSEIRQEYENRCRISVYLINYPPVAGYTNGNWRAGVDCGAEGFFIRIDPFSGKLQE